MRAVLDHFEIPTADAPGLTAFLREVFGWQPSPTNLEHPSYTRLDTASFSGGSRVGLWQGSQELLEAAVPVVRIEGEPLEDCLERVTLAGGMIALAPTPVPGAGRFARFRDPEGNEWGLFEAVRASV